VPEDRRAQDLTVAVEHDEAVHLAGEPERPVREARANGLDRPPPVLGILLGPAGLRCRDRVALLPVALLLHGEDRAVPVDRDALDGARPDVDPDESRLLSHRAARAETGTVALGALPPRVEAGRRLHRLRRPGRARARRPARAGAGRTRRARPRRR